MFKEKLKRIGHNATGRWDINFTLTSSEFQRLPEISAKHINFQKFHSQALTERKRKR